MLVASKPFRKLHVLKLVFSVLICRYEYVYIYIYIYIYTIACMHVPCLSSSFLLVRLDTISVFMALNASILS